jgi:hypothetical protein
MDRSLGAFIGHLVVLLVRMTGYQISARRAKLLPGARALPIFRETVAETGPSQGLSLLKRTCR